LNVKPFLYQGDSFLDGYAVQDKIILLPLNGRLRINLRFHKLVRDGIHGDLFVWLYCSVRMCIVTNRDFTACYSYSDQLAGSCINVEGRPKHCSDDFPGMNPEGARGIVGNIEKRLARQLDLTL